MLKEKKILTLIYGDPGYYPPTLNAINELSDIYDEVTVIYRPFLPRKYNFSKNVKLKPSGKRIEVKSQESAPLIFKFFYQLQFICKVFSEILSRNYDTILFYDHLATLSLYLVQPFVSKKVILWYHNHDVATIDKVKKYSIGWLAIKAQNLIMGKIDVFSLPSEERLKYFSYSKITKVFILPNFPSQKRYGLNKIYSVKSEMPVLLYQGTINEGHGLIEINSAINNSNKLSDFRLCLVGNVDSKFKLKLERKSVSKKVNYLGYVAYNSLPQITSKCHIGIAVLIPQSINFKTASLASNKIYEYAACGLPILYFDDSHYNESLSRFEWAFATDLTEASIERCLERIMKNYEYLSKKAREDFENELNFELVFKPIHKYLVNELN